MQIRFATGKKEFSKMATAELRETFLLDSLFTAGAVQLVYWETDRAVIGSAVPLEAPLELEADAELASEYFCERRELGVLNLGGNGAIEVDGTRHALAPLDALYVSRGSQSIVFSSDDPATPARYYLVSYPAHAEYPTTRILQSAARQIQLGSRESANERTIYQYIHEDGAKSCQLVMGFTQLAVGSVWNTFPPHTHLRRSEVYLYFNLPNDSAVFHLMGPGEETRHLVVRNEQVALSPAWSIHSGCGTQAYSFVWAMGGENQRFTDMDGIAVRDLR